MALERKADARVPSTARSWRGLWSTLRASSQSTNRARTGIWSTKGCSASRPAKRFWSLGWGQHILAEVEAAGLERR
eukprot:9481262-Lingulodinium_polyedra.AAC.1